jgi:hypothetical protein
MQSRKDGHFDADQKRRNPDFQVRVSHFGGRFDNVKGRGSEYANHEGLPEGKKDYKLDGCDLQEWSMLSKVRLQLNIELN